MALTLDRPKAPTRRRLDVTAYHRMAEAGILGPEDRVELIDGEIIDMAPIGAEHAGRTNRLVAAFGDAATRGLAVLSVQNPLRLTPFDEPQPDLMLLRPRDDFYTSTHPVPADVLLLIEVADSSLAYDRGTKLPLYARHFIPEVWLVDLLARAVEVHTDPVDGAFTQVRRVTEGRLAPRLVSEVAVDVEALLG